MNFAEPNSRLRRSPLYRRHLRDGGAFVEVGGQLVVGHYKDIDVELQVARRLSLCDLSTLARGGLAGSGASAYLSSGYVDLPATHNDSRRQMNGDTIAKLAECEYLHLGSSALFGTVSDVPAWEGNPEVKAYSLPRQDSHCWFALTGSEAAITLSKLCAIDFREHKFADGCVAQTSLARVSAIVIRSDIGGTATFFILASSSATEYLWDCVIDAMHELDGCAVGIDVLKKLTG